MRSQGFCRNVNLCNQTFVCGTIITFQNPLRNINPKFREGRWVYNSNTAIRKISNQITSLSGTVTTL